AETDKINFVILGIGVNLNMKQDQFPSDLRRPATSLYIETGQHISRALFAKTMLKELDKLYNNFLAKGYETVRKEWMKRSNMAGESVTVTEGKKHIIGKVIGINEYGALLLEDKKGNVTPIMTGDVKIN
ncbi:MAG: biotin--[acetyl-CoA-carboxylase] ligase, partial [Desulfuromonadales bacterium]|nr:biotin--[acetyl-CoA-carboxylase] ligase [Desulfuromonadales bacterium]